MAAKIAMLEVVVIVLLVLEKKEKRRRRRRRKYTTAARISGDSQQNGCFDGFRNDCGAGME